MNRFKSIEPTSPQWPSDACKYAATFVWRQCNFHPHNEQSEQLISMRRSTGHKKSTYMKKRRPSRTICGSIDLDLCWFTRFFAALIGNVPGAPRRVRRPLCDFIIVVLLSFWDFRRSAVVRRVSGTVTEDPHFPFVVRFSEFSFFVSAHVAAIVRIVLCYVSLLVDYYCTFTVKTDFV